MLVLSADQAQSVARLLDSLGVDVSALAAFAAQAKQGFLAWEFHAPLTAEKDMCRILLTDKLELLADEAAVEREGLTRVRTLLQDLAVELSLREPGLVEPATPGTLTRPSPLAEGS